MADPGSPAATVGAPAPPPEPSFAPGPHRYHWTRRLAWLVALAVLVATGLGLGIGLKLGGAFNPHLGPVPSGTRAAGSPSNAAQLAQRAAAGVVDINVTMPYQHAAGEGTGIVLSKKGEVLTNNHVIEGEGTLSVWDVGNGRTYSARVVGYDRSQDIAVLHLVGASGLETVPIGNSAAVHRGQGVVALGNADGTGGTPHFAAGTVTATNQSITAADQLTGSFELLRGMIRTNAHVIPGDSGGALIGHTGKVVGIVTAGSHRYHQRSVQGYAIPANRALALAHQIESGRSAAGIHLGGTAFLGILGGTSTGPTPGVTVAQVLPHGPAQAAGLVPGDVITTFAGNPVPSAGSLTNQLLGLRPGSRAKLGYTTLLGRSGTVTVTSGPPQ